MKKEKPTHLYKFRSISDPVSYERTIKSIKNNSITFATGPTFNDPFDSDISIPMIWDTQESFIKLADSLGVTDPKEIMVQYASRRLERRKRNNELSENEINILSKIKHSLNNYYIFCASRDNKNHLLWSHYADSHKGICIRYNYRKLISGLDTYADDDINYNDSPIDLSDTLTKNDLFLDFLFKKSTDWRYEDEYRLILNKTKNEGEENYNNVKSNEELSDMIIFGFDCNIEMRVRIMNDLNDSNIIFKQVERSKISYNLIVNTENLSITNPIAKK